MTHWQELSRPPASALKKITGGRMNGKSDISPQWRYEIMDKTFGQCGVGWKFEIVRLWTETGTDGQVFVFAQVNIFTKEGDDWSEPIPGVGGHFLIEQETKGLHCNDEAFKMAITDALGTALKMIGVAADIYMGKWDGMKYRDDIPPQTQNLAPKPTAEEIKAMKDRLGGLNAVNKNKATQWFTGDKPKKIEDITLSQLAELDKFIAPLEAAQAEAAEKAKLEAHKQAAQEDKHD